MKKRGIIALLVIVIFLMSAIGIVSATEDYVAVVRCKSVAPDSPTGNLFYTFSLAAFDDSGASMNAQKASQEACALLGMVVDDVPFVGWAFSPGAKEDLEISDYVDVVPLKSKGPYEKIIGWVYGEEEPTLLPRDSAGEEVTASRIKYCDTTGTLPGKTYRAKNITFKEPFPPPSTICILLPSTVDAYEIQGMTVGGQHVIGRILTEKPAETAEEYIDRLEQEKLNELLNAEPGSYVAVVRCKSAFPTGLDSYTFSLTAFNDSDTSMNAEKACDLVSAGLVGDMASDGGIIGYAFSKDITTELPIRDYVALRLLREKGAEMSTSAGEAIGWAYLKAPDSLPRDSAGKEVDVYELKYCPKAKMPEDVKGYIALTITATEPYPWKSCIPSSSAISVGSILTEKPAETPKAYLIRAFGPPLETPPGQTHVNPTLKECVDSAYEPKSTAAPSTWPPSIQPTLTNAQAIERIYSFESKIQSIICKNKCLRPQLAQQNPGFIQDNCEGSSDVLATNDQWACVDNEYEAQLDNYLKSWPLPALPPNPTDHQLKSRILTSKAMVQDIVCRNSCLRTKLETGFVRDNCKKITAGTPPEGTSTPVAFTPAQGEATTPIAFPSAQQTVTRFIGMVTGRVVSLLR